MDETVIGQWFRCLSGRFKGENAQVVRAEPDRDLYLMKIATDLGWYRASELAVPLPSPSQPASQWVDEGNNVWTGPGCSYWESDGRHAVAGFPGCQCACGLSYRDAVEAGYIPRDSAEAPKEQYVRGMDPAFDAPPEVKEACRVFNRDHGPRAWDCDKYNGLDAETYAQLSDLDKRIAAARELLDRPAPVRFPSEAKSDRVYGGRRW